MENATKALLIAGSVLIAILLIAMGVRIFSSTSSTVESSEATMQATAITTFNTQFAGYTGSNISASKVNTLKQKVIASNAVNKEHQVSGSITNFTGNTGTYTVTASDTNNDGYIDVINVASE